MNNDVYEFPYQEILKVTFPCVPKFDIKKKAQPVLLSTKLSLFRNFSGIDFLPLESNLKRKKIAQKVFQISENIKDLTFSTCPEELLDFFCDKGILPELIKENDFNVEDICFLQNKTADVFTFFNVEEHLNIYALSHKLAFSQLLKRASVYENNIAKRYGFAFSKKYGYLNANAAHIGTGIELEAVVHLYGLKQMGKLAYLEKSLADVGLSFSLWKNTDDLKSIPFYLIKTRFGFGESEEHLIDRFEAWIKNISALEMKMRREYILQNKDAIIGAISKNYKEITNPLLSKISYAGGLNSLSMIRLACDAGFFEEDYRALVDYLIIQSQDSLLRLRAVMESFSNHNNPNILRTEDSIMRANLFKKYCAILPPPVTPQ